MRSYNYNGTTPLATGELPKSKFKSQIQRCQDEYDQDAGEQKTGMFGGLFSCFGSKNQATSAEINMAPKDIKIQRMGQASAYK